MLGPLHSIRCIGYKSRMASRSMHSQKQHQCPIILKEIKDEHVWEVSLLPWDTSWLSCSLGEPNSLQVNLSSTSRFPACRSTFSAAASQMLTHVKVYFKCCQNESTPNGLPRHRTSLHYCITGDTQYPSSSAGRNPMINRTAKQQTPNTQEIKRTLKTNEPLSAPIGYTNRAPSVLSLGSRWPRFHIPQILLIS